jgi:hypothetical protein
MKGRSLVEPRGVTGGYTRRDNSENPRLRWMHSTEPRIENRESWRGVVSGEWWVVNPSPSLLPTSSVGRSPQSTNSCTGVGFSTGIFSIFSIFYLLYLLPSEFWIWILTSFKYDLYRLLAAFLVLTALAFKSIRKIKNSKSKARMLTNRVLRWTSIYWKPLSLVWIILLLSPTPIVA